MKGDSDEEAETVALTFKDFKRIGSIKATVPMWGICHLYS